VTYEPPPGWVESLETETGENEYGLFHLREDCERIRQPERLRKTDKPYSAARCRFCSSA
jgi:hypothetical protein